MRKTTILILGAAALLTCCRTNRATRDLFRQADALMETKPDSVLNMLENFDAGQLSDRASRARYALLYSRALDKNYIDLTTDSVIAPAVSYYAGHGNDRDKAFTYYYLGRIRDNAGFPGEAAKLMLEAAKYAERIQDTKLLGMIYNCRGNLYYSQYSFKEAIGMYSKADSCMREIENAGFSALMIKAKAKTYILMEQYEIAEMNLKRSLLMFDSLGNKTQATIIASGLATMALDAKKASTDSLKCFLNDSYSKYTSKLIPDADNLLWVRIYLAENKTDSARYYGKRAMERNSVSPDRKCGALSLMAKIEAQAKNYREASDYQTKSYLLFDSITRAEKLQLIQQVEKRYQNQDLQHQNEMLRMHTQFIFYVGLLIFLIVFSAFLLILRHRRIVIRRKSKEIVEYKQFIEQLSEDYANLEEQYTQMAVNTKGDSEEERNMLKALENRLTTMKGLLDIAYSGECKPAAFYLEFKEKIAVMNRGESAFSDLQYLVNKRNCGVIDYLRKTYPSLTSSELDMLSMILFGFSFDCVRLIYNHDNVDSLYSRRTKIREKLQLPPRFRLERYLVELVERLKGGRASNGAQNA